VATQYVIVVAGFAGNELWLPALPVVGDLRVWFDPPVLLTGAWRSMGLAADGITPAIPFQPALQGRLVLGSYYGVLSDTLAREGYVPVSYQQDWRLTQARCVSGLVSLILELGAVRPVHLVCHSRGGLVLRAALQALSLAQRQARVGRVVGLGVPHQGSWQGARLIACTDPSIVALSTVLEVAPALLAGQVPMAALYRMVDSWPGAYELLPRPGAAGVDPATIAAVYAPATWSTIRPQVQAQWLAAASAWWAGLPYAPDDVRWLDVVGGGTRTAVTLLDVTRPDLATSYGYSTAGDGTVPQAWALQPGRALAPVTAGHGAMPYDPAVLSVVSEWLGA